MNLKNYIKIRIDWSS